MNFKMSAAEVPAKLVDSITMEIGELELIIDRKLWTSMTLTRSVLAILIRVYQARLFNQFDYQEFQDEADANVRIMMNELIKSPQYWSQSDFENLQ